MPLKTTRDLRAFDTGRVDDLLAQDKAFALGREVSRNWTGPLGAPLPPPVLAVKAPHIPRPVPRLWDAAQECWGRIRECVGYYCDEAIGATIARGVSWIGAWLIVGIIAACSWVARQSRAVRLKAARARRKKVRKARKHIQALFALERSTEFACLSIAASAYEASQAEYERTHELTLTLAGAGLWAVTIATSRSWS